MTITELVSQMAAPGVDQALLIRKCCIVCERPENECVCMENVTHEQALRVVQVIDEANRKTMLH